MLHQANIIVHVVSGTVALILGALAIAFNNRLQPHKKLGLAFLYFLGVVVATGFVGWLLFRSDPFLLMLTILSGYEGFAGYRIIKAKENRPAVLDVSIAIVALTIGMVYVFYLSGTKAGISSPVVKSTLIALVIITAYDITKYFFTYRYVRSWWLYEHIYKMISAFSAILSAFVGTVVVGFRPYSQLGPSVICIWLIVFFIWRRAKSQ